MEQERNQYALRQSFIFRLLVLIASVFGCALYFILNADYPTLSGFVFGLSGSGFMWSLVEIVDFFIEIHKVFEKERSLFFVMLEKYWSQLRCFFRSANNAKDVDWDKVIMCINNLYNDVATFPFQGGIYSISKEFEEATIYITRLYWKATGYANSKKRENTQNYWKAFYDDFVEVLCSAKEGINELKEIEIINHRIDELRKIDLSFDDFNHPEGMIGYKDNGDLGALFLLGSERIRIKTFKPARDFHKKFHVDTQYNAIPIVWELLIRKIKKWH